MSLKQKLLKNRNLKTFHSLKSEDFSQDLLSYFKEHDDLQSITVYSFDKIFAEKNNQVFPISFSFSSRENYFAERDRILKFYDINVDENNPFISAEISENILLQTAIPPLVKEEPILVFSRKNNYYSDDYYEKKVISYEMSEYLKCCLLQKANIFVIGDADAQKSLILNFLLDLTDNYSKCIIYNPLDNLMYKNKYFLNVGQTFFNNIPNIKYDNIFCSDISHFDMNNIFKAIISGYKGFVISLSLKNNIDILEALRNLILLSNTNLFEENADFLTASSIDVIIFTENDNNNNICITKISEVIRNRQNNLYLKDIFVKHDKGVHISTGNSSQFYNPKFVQNFNSLYLSENHINSYREKPFEKLLSFKNNSDEENITLEKNLKRKSLKEKLLKFKKANLAKKINSDIDSISAFPVEKEVLQKDIQKNVQPEITSDLQTEDNINIAENTELKQVDIIEENPELIQEKFNYEEIKDIDNNIEQENIDNTVTLEKEEIESELQEEDNIIEEQPLLIDNTELNVETNINQVDFEIDNTKNAPKIKNIFVDDDNENENPSDNIYNSTDLIVNNNTYIPDFYEDDITAKYKQGFTEKQNIDPVLFSEISDIDMQEYESNIMDTPEDI